MYKVIKIILIVTIKIKQLHECINPGGGYSKCRPHILIIVDLWTDDSS